MSKSKVLAKDVNGSMKENETKTIEIEDVDGDIDDETVMRFLEYVYTGDYTVPNPVVLELPFDTKEVKEVVSSKETAQSKASKERFFEHEQNLDYLDIEETQGKEMTREKKRWRKLAPQQLHAWYTLLPEEELGIVHDTFGHPLAELRGPNPFVSGTGTITRTRLWGEFCSAAKLAYARLPEPRSWLPPVDNNQCEDFSSVFLCHARLYKFSDRYDMPQLVTLSLQRLRATLSKYEFHQERASAVVDLIRYAYQHTMEYEEGYDKLRLLVLDYTVCYVQQLAREPSFIDLMKEPGPLATDLLGKMVALFE